MPLNVLQGLAAACIFSLLLGRCTGCPAGQKCCYCSPIGIYIYSCARRCGKCIVVRESRCGNALTVPSLSGGAVELEFQNPDSALSAERRVKEAFAVSEPRYNCTASNSTLICSFMGSPDKELIPLTQLLMPAVMNATDHPDISQPQQFQVVQVQ